MKLEGRLFRFLLVLRQVKPAHFGGSSRMIFPQRMALPGRRHQDSAEMRMAVEGDAEQVPRFAFVPVGCRPNLSDGLEGRGRSFQRNLEADVFIPLERE